MSSFPCILPVTINAKPAPPLHLPLSHFPRQIKNHSQACRLVLFKHCSSSLRRPDLFTQFRFSCASQRRSRTVAPKAFSQPRHTQAAFRACNAFSSPTAFWGDFPYSCGRPHLSRKLLFSIMERQTFTLGFPTTTTPAPGILHP